MADSNVTPDRAATLTDERVDRIVRSVFAKKWPQTPEPRSDSMRDICRLLVRHAYDVGYDDGWAEGVTSDA